MYDKKQALGFILIIMVVMTYTQFVFAPTPISPTSPQGAGAGVTSNSSQPSLNIQQISALPASAPSPTNVASTTLAKIPSLAEIAQAPKTVIHSGVSTITITHLGGRILGLELNNVFKELGKTEPLNLITAVEGVSLPAGLQFGASSDEGLKYEISDIQGFERKDSSDLQVPNAGNASLTLKANINTGQTLTKTFLFKSNSYLFNVRATISPAVSTSDDLTLLWPIHLDQEALHQTYDPYFISILSDSNKVRHIPATGDLKEFTKLQNAQWIAFGDRYFNTAIIPAKQQQSVKVESFNGLFALYARGLPNTLDISIFAGPKTYQVLKSEGQQLERTVDLGFFSFVAHPLLQLLKFLFAIFGNYGVAIVALTLLVKTLFYPLNKASLKSMRAMQELGPEIAALKERVKDSTQLNQETLALYKRKGVNPMGGCLPVFIQIPVFFGLYSALQNAVELRHAPFALWVKDLATPEKLHFLGINFPIMVLAMGIIMFLQQYRTPMPNMDANQRKMMLGMSVVFTGMFLIFPFPAGLALYMLVNTTISLVQQQCIRSETMNKPFRVTLIASMAILLAAFIFSKA
jgi:YidC/Oxa1 family membrane protein insertase